MYNLTKALKDDGVPIHYVGSQSHIDLRFAEFDGFTDSVKEYAQVCEIATYLPSKDFIFHCTGEVAYSDTGYSDTI